MSLSFLSRLPGAPPHRGVHLQPPGISEEGWQGAPRGRGLPQQGFASSSPAYFQALCNLVLFSAYLQAARCLKSLHCCISRSRVVRQPQACAGSCSTWEMMLVAPLFLFGSSFILRGAIEVHLSLLSKPSAGSGAPGRAKAAAWGGQARPRAQASPCPGVAAASQVGHGAFHPRHRSGCTAWCRRAFSRDSPCSC